MRRPPNARLQHIQLAGSGVGGFGTGRYGACSIRSMAHRLNLTLDDQHAAKLDRMADRAHLNSGTLARSMLCEAIDQADAVITEQAIAAAGPAAMAAILTGIPGFQKRFERGLADAAAGRTIPLDEL
jgi:predicted transcriptional regulator